MIASAANIEKPPKAISANVHISTLVNTGSDIVNPQINENM